MKGAVFVALNEMIESQYGLAVWEELLEDVSPVSQGIYTSAENYPDQEIIDFVIAISKKLSLPSTKVTKIFGRYLFDELNGKFPEFSQLTPAFFPFLESIETIIHKEVRKLYEEVSLPSLGTKMINEDLMEFTYFSPRKLCYLAEGLIFGAADFFGESITVEHLQCMHNDDAQCLLRISRNES